MPYRFRRKKLKCDKNSSFLYVSLAHHRGNDCNYEKTDTAVSLPMRFRQDMLCLNLSFCNIFIGFFVQFPAANTTSCISFRKYKYGRKIMPGTNNVLYFTNLFILIL